jgi:DNA (cytosine-5)-methyltransferase 1
MGERVRKGIDLFAGPGGLSLGLIGAGFEMVGAVEWDPHAGRTYRHNIGDHVYVRDLREFGPRDMERALKKERSIRSKYDIDLISGGPPCPGFSLIGRSKISNLIQTGQWEGSDSRHRFIDDQRNDLFREFVKYVGHFKPRYFLMENVSGMTSYKSGEDSSIVDVIVSEFENLGYRVKVRLLLASEFGVPQDRKRIIFLGWKKGQCEPDFPVGSDRRITAAEAIQDLPQVDPGTGRSTSEKLKRMADIPRRGSPGYSFLQRVRGASTPLTKPTVGRRVTLHHTRKVNPRDVGIFPLIESGEFGERVLYKDVYPERLSEVILPDGYEHSTVDGNPVVVGTKSGDDRSWKWYNPTKFGDKMRRIRGDRPAPTIVAHLAKDGYMFIHPYEDRTITVREAARFQSFPDSFDLSAGGAVPISSQFRQVGNAVPPILAEALGSCLLKAMGTD